MKEVLAKAEKEEEVCLERERKAAAPTDCEVTDNANATVRLQRVRIHDLEEELQRSQSTLLGTRPFLFKYRYRPL